MTTRLVQICFVIGHLIRSKRPPGKYGLPRRRPLARWVLTIAVATASIGCTVPPALAGAENRLFSAAVGLRGKLDDAMKSKIIRHRFVTVDVKRLLPPKSAANNPSTEVVVLNLFDNAIFRAVLDRRESRSPNSFTWIGHVEGVENSQVTLVGEDGVVSGNIRLDHGWYQIRYAGEGTHVVYQVDPNAFPDEGKPLTVPRARD